MSQAHVFIQVMLIRAAKTAVSNPNEDLVAIQLAAVGGSLDDAPIWRAFVDDETDAFGGG